MVTKREIYQIIAAYGLGYGTKAILPRGSTRQAAKITITRIARPLAGLAFAAARANPPLALFGAGVAAHELGYLDPLYERAAPVRKKAMSKFNQAVKKGMAIVKASPQYGKKGVISNSKKAFAAVTKTVSKVRRGKPKPKRGNIALTKVWNMAVKLTGLVPPKGPRGKKYKLPKRRTTTTRPYQSQGGR